VVCLSSDSAAEERLDRAIANDNWLQLFPEHKC